MRFIYQIAFAALVVTMSASCGDFFELDYQDNPNAVTPENAGPEFVFNSIQLNTVGCFLNMHNISDGLVRHTDMANFTYREALPAGTSNGLWNNAYANLFPDVDVFVEAANRNSLLEPPNISLEADAAMAQVMKAYVMIGLVDMYGDVPYSEALQGTDVISPNVDGGDIVYAEAEGLLNLALETFRTTADVGPSYDQMYGGDLAKWATLANTLKLKMAVSTRLVGGGTKIAGILAAEEGIIDTPDEDWLFKSSTERDNPNSRHPFYNDAYENADATYMGNYFMWLLSGEKDSIRDPRIRSFFYRQVDNSVEQDVNVYSCILSDLPDPAETPSWYLEVDPRMPYCVASEDGYYGRDHGNGSGIPPDGPIRTVYGVYPGGGKWDNNSYAFTQNGGTDGALGEGFAPLVTSYMVHFWLAEAAAAGDYAGDAKALMMEGISQHIDKTREFDARIPQSDLDYVIGFVVGTTPPEPIPASSLLPADSTYDAYMAEVEARYDAASDKLDVIMKEGMIAFYGNSYEFFNAYRRTGRPLNMQPGIDQAIGQFPRSLLYASDNVNLNSSITQKEDLQVLVFWDDGSATLR